MDFDKVEYPEAYARAVKRNIIQNARKTFESNFHDASDIVAYVERKGVESYNGPAGVVYRDGFFGSLAKSLNDFGKLTPKQVESVRRYIEQDAVRRAEWADKQAAINASRVHLGTVGEKFKFHATVRKVIELESEFGISYLWIMEDDDQNVVIYKGTSKAFNPVHEKDVIEFVAFVKDHGVRNGVRQTVVRLPKDLVIIQQNGTRD